MRPTTVCIAAALAAAVLAGCGSEGRTTSTAWPGYVLGSADAAGDRGINGEGTTAADTLRRLRPGTADTAASGAPGASDTTAGDTAAARATAPRDTGARSAAPSAATPADTAR